MTLILSAVVGDYIVQVSDRRLTRNGQLVDDDRNKAVLFCNRLCFAYTGLALIGRTPTDQWLTQALVNARTEDIRTAANSLSVQATRAFTKIGYARPIKRHAFVGVGWARLPKEDFLSPIVCSVTNAHTSSGVWLDQAQDYFTAFHLLGSDKPVFDVIATGQHLTSGEIRQLCRRLRRCFERQTGPEPVAKCLVDAIHKVAARNPLVGKKLMVVSLPKRSVLASPQMFLTNLAPSAPMTMKDNQSFHYLSENGTIQFAPNTACIGHGFRDIRLERLNASGSDASIEVAVVLPEE